MTAEQINQLISSLGFPIVCVGGMAWFVVWYIRKVEDERKQRESELAKTIDTNTDAINSIKSMVETFMNYVCKMNDKGE